MASSAQHKPRHEKKSGTTEVVAPPSGGPLLCTTLSRQYRGFWSAGLGCLGSCENPVYRIMSTQLLLLHRMPPPIPTDRFIPRFRPSTTQQHTQTLCHLFNPHRWRQIIQQLVHTQNPMQPLWFLPCFPWLKNPTTRPPSKPGATPPTLRADPQKSAPTTTSPPAPAPTLQQQRSHATTGV